MVIGKRAAHPHPKFSGITSHPPPPQPPTPGTMDKKIHSSSQTLALDITLLNVYAGTGSIVQGLKCPWISGCVLRCAALTWNCSISNSNSLLNEFRRFESRQYITLNYYSIFKQIFLSCLKNNWTCRYSNKELQIRRRKISAMRTRYTVLIMLTSHQVITFMYIYSITF